MDKKTAKKVNDLINDKFAEDDFDENDLENELDAILNGKPTRAAPPTRQNVTARQTKTSRVATTRKDPVTSNVGQRNNLPMDGMLF